MPQEFQVLKCFSCETFNTDIVKKNNTKWQCKLCGEKQSVKKVYFQSSSAQDCRQAVQTLNENRGSKDEQEEEFTEYDEFTEEASDSVLELNESKIVKIPGQVSRWHKYQIDFKE